MRSENTSNGADFQPKGLVKAHQYLSFIALSGCRV